MGLRGTEAPKRRAAARAAAPLPLSLMMLLVLIHPYCSHAAGATGPEPDPMNSGNRYTGVFGTVSCQADEVVRPTSTDDLAAAVRRLQQRAAAQGRPLKMRATHTKFASTASFPCPGGENGGSGGSGAVKQAAPLRVAVLLNDMNKVLSVDQRRHHMRVQAGIKLRDLLPAATRFMMSVPRASVPWWGDIIIGGAASAGAHGSGWGVPAEVCDIVASITWVDASGAAHTSANNTEEWRALCAGIGLIGIITEVTLQLEPLSYTQLSTRKMVGDANFVSDLEQINKTVTTHMTVLWRPDFNQYTAYLQAEPPAGAAKAKDVIRGARGLIEPPLSPSVAFRQFQGDGLRKWQAYDYFNVSMDADEALVCASGHDVIAQPWAQVSKFPPDESGPPPRDIFEGVAPTNDVQTFVCSDESKGVRLCVFDNPELNATTVDVEVAVERRHLPEIVKDVRALIAADLKGFAGTPDGYKRCLGPGYFQVRFTNPSKTLIGAGAGLEAPMYFELALLGSRNTPGKPFRHQFVQEVLEQLLLCKYGGRPHWGKNVPRVFTHPTCTVASKHGDNFQRMLAMQDKHDPARVFEPSLWSVVAKGGSSVRAPKCSVDNACYCTEDAHCADGFECVPSTAFPEYKACFPRKPGEAAGGKKPSPLRAEHPAMLGWRVSGKGARGKGAGKGAIDIQRFVEGWLNALLG